MSQGYHHQVHYLLDGYNLAHWLAGGRDLDPAGLRDLLLRELVDRVPRDAQSVRIYWDVADPSRLLGANAYLDWCTMHSVPDADAAIIDAVWASDAPRTLVVVSGDREVVGRCKRLGAKTRAPGDLLPRRRDR